MAEHRQQEGQGLAGAGLGHADDIAAAHDGRDGLSLDGKGLLEAVAVDAAEDPVRQAALLPRVHRRRTALAADAYLQLVALLQLLLLG